ncbi:MAG: ComEC/Rec2 family competence protein [Patescibacteria group bacterium]
MDVSGIMVIYPSYHVGRIQYGGFMNRTISKHYASWTVLGILLVLNIFIWTATMRADRHGVLTVAFLGVGQGDAIYIEAPNGNQMLIDGGVSSGAILRPLGRVMPFFDRSLDLVLATHPDQDHVGGLPSVLDRLSVDGVVTTENTSDTGAYAAFENAIEREHAKRILARTGERIILDEGVVLEILFPAQSTAGWETNMGSIVARLSYGNTSFLFTGDSPIAIEKYLVGREGGLLKTDVLKLGHHGSRTSSSCEFLSAVNPEYAIISAGKDNKYGHPHKEVTALLEELKISARSTAEQGTLIFKSDGETVRGEHK